MVKKALTVEILFVVMIQVVYVWDNWVYMSLSPGNVWISSWCFCMYFLIFHTKNRTCRRWIHILWTTVLILCERNVSWSGISFRWYFLANWLAASMTRSKVSPIVPSKSRKIALIIYFIYPLKNSFRLMGFLPSGLREICSTASLRILFSLSSGLVFSCV